MSVAVRPLRPDEYDAWLARSKAGYLASMTNEGGVPAERAGAKADADYASLLPNGLETEGHSIYAVDEDGELVGELWLAERVNDLGRSLYVYEVSVREESRGRGFGRAAMVFTEEEARRRGIASISLNVFGGNDAARGLYRSLGYREVAVFMAKDV